MSLSTELVDQLWQDLHDLSELNNAEAIQAIVTIIHRDKTFIVDNFYRSLLQSQDTAHFLSAIKVENQLKPNLERWLEILLCCNNNDDLKAALDMQCNIGDVHARAGIPVNMVARAIRILKYEINQCLLQSDLDRHCLVDAVLRVDYLMDIAFESMSAAFVSSLEQSVRTETSFRLLYTGQNMALERERQQRALLEWENRFFRVMANDLPIENLMPIRLSSFGLWVMHKAPLIFKDMLELPLLETAITRIDDDLLPQLSAIAAKGILKAILAETEQIRYLLTTMYERMTEMEMGRDSLTQLFNRRFMPTILKREVELSRHKGVPFCVLVIEIDFFKSVNDAYNYDIKDKAIRQVAVAITDTIHEGDFAFRYSEEKFLIVLAESDDRQAAIAAEKIREHIEVEEIPLSSERSVKVTVSIGIAMSNNHPDYQRLIERADAALCDAKQLGGNRCAVA